MPAAQPITLRLRVLCPQVADARNGHAGPGAAERCKLFAEEVTAKGVRVFFAATAGEFWAAYRAFPPPKHFYEVAHTS